MPGGLISVFGEVEDFQASMSADGTIRLLTTEPGHFRASLTQLSLHRIRLAAAEERLSRIAFVEVPSNSVLVALAVGKEPLPAWSGVRMRIGEIITISAGERIHVRTIGPCRWSTLLVLEQDLLLYGQVMTAASFSIPPGITRWRPVPAIETQLRRLHRAAIRIGEARSGSVTDAAAVHTLEQQLFHALVDALAGGPIEGEPPAVRRHRQLLMKLEELLQNTSQQNAAGAGTALGTSDRLLRKCASDLLGVPLSRYIRLARMQQVHRELRGADAGSLTIAEVAARYGFRDLGRFAANYRAVYDELPSATLRRPPIQGSQALLRAS